MKFKLGQEVKDIITGYKGIVEAITTWLNGCVRITIQPRELDKDGVPKTARTFDADQLEYVGPGLTAETAAPDSTGGPYDAPSVRPDPSR
jgi:hypothetical protein